MLYSGEEDRSILGVGVVKTKCLGWSGLAGAPWVGTLPGITQRNLQSSLPAPYSTSSAFSLPQRHGGGVVHGHSPFRPDWQILPLSR